MVILLFGAGTDYGLLLISRYREDLRGEGDARVGLATALGEDVGGHRRQRPHGHSGGAHLFFAQYGDYRSSR